jgi:hypothetical protein
VDIEITIGYEVANLKVTLSEFSAIIEHISGEAKLQEVRQAIKEMIEEVSVSYKTAVDVFTPLYELNTGRKFNSKFSGARANFKNNYLKSAGKVRTSCGIVTDKLNTLRQRRAWMKNLPFVRRSFERLEALGNNWISNDGRLAQGMDSFLNSMNRFLDRVSKAQKANPAEAFRYLQSSLAQYEDDLLAISERLNKIKQVSAKL